MSGTGQQAITTASYPLSCHRCRSHVRANADAAGFDCPNCATRHTIYECQRCGKADVIPGGGILSYWNCRWCLQENQISKIRRGGRPATAAAAWAALDEHGVTRENGEVRLLGGFTLVAGSGNCPPIGTLCTIVGLTEGVLVVAELGAQGQHLLRYDDLLVAAVEGRGLLTTNGGYYGGGLGIRGSLTGIAIASMLNSATTKSTLESFLRLISRDTEMLFRHWKYTPQTIRNGLSPIFVRHLAASRTPTVIHIESPRTEPTRPRRPRSRRRPARSTSSSGSPGSTTQAPSPTPSSRPPGQSTSANSARVPHSVTIVLTGEVPVVPTAFDAPTARPLAPAQTCPAIASSSFDGRR